MEQLCSISPGACLAGMYLSCAALAFWTVPLEVGRDCGTQSCSFQRSL